MNDFSAVHRRGRRALFVLLSFVGFYSDCEYLPTAVKYGVCLLTALWAAAAFLLFPDTKRAALCARFGALFCVPYLVFWVWSAGLWIVGQQDPAYILRGTKNIVYMLVDLLYVCAAVYLLGREAMPCSFAAMAMAHLAVLAQVVRAFGPAQVLRDIVCMLVTFSARTGPAAARLELHGLAFGWGIFVLWFWLAERRRTAWRWAALAASAVFLALSFKRILVPAILGGAVVLAAARRCSPAALGRLAVPAAAGVGAGAWGYLAVIQNGSLFALAERWGVNLMFRDVLYRYYSGFFRLSPAYLGRGIRFIYAHAARDPAAYEAVHNVYLEFFLEVGFWCWWFWLFYELAFRVRRVLAWGYGEAARVLAAMNAFVFCTYLTDNTSFYFCINVLYRLAVMTAALAPPPLKGPKDGPG